MFLERIVNVPGDALLPPNPDPIFPDDLKPDERVVVHPPVPPWQPRDAADGIALFENPELQDRRYFVMKDAYERHPKQIEWLNEAPIGTPYGLAKGLAALPAICVFELPFRNQSLGRFPDYVDYNGIVSIGSTRLVQLLQNIDADGIETRPVQLVDRAGNLVSEDFMLVDFVRVRKAVDYANSTVKYHGPVIHLGRELPAWVEAWRSVRLMEDAIASGQIFRNVATTIPSAPLVPRAVYDLACVAKPKMTNINFQNLASGI